MEASVTGVKTTRGRGSGSGQTQEVAHRIEVLGGARRGVRRSTTDEEVGAPRFHPRSPTRVYRPDAEVAIALILARVDASPGKESSLVAAGKRRR